MCSEASTKLHNDADPLLPTQRMHPRLVANLLVVIEMESKDYANAKSVVRVNPAIAAPKDRKNGCFYCL